MAHDVFPSSAHAGSAAATPGLGATARIRDHLAARAVERVTRGPDERASGALPPGPRTSAVAQLLGFLYEPVAFLDAVRARYGRTLTLRLPGVPPLVMFSDPEAVREVFAGGADELLAGQANNVLAPFLGDNSVLVLDGARHHSQRRLLLPPFRGERMRAYGDAMRELTLAQMRAWPASGGVVRMQTETQAITLEVILRTVFGMEAGAAQDRMRALLVAGLAVLDKPLLLVRGFQRDLGPLSPWGRFLRLRARLHGEMDALIAARRAAGRGEDILSLLASATHEDGTPMSDAEIRDELLTLLVAGHETTATALAWAMHRLSRHADVLREVQAEIDRAFPAGVEPERLRELPYLEALCKEVLRIHPVVPGVGRVLARAMRIGGVELPAGVAVGCSIYLVHSDPRVWPEPERFDPRRFLDGRATPSTYFPFGGGLRRCIGEAFALYEMRVVLATMLREFAPEAAAPRIRTVRRSVTLVPDRLLPLRLRRRRAA